MNSNINKRYVEELVAERTIAEIREAGSLWQAMRSEVQARAEFEPIMSTFFHATVLNHDTIEGALEFSFGQQTGQSCCLQHGNSRNH